MHVSDNSEELDEFQKKKWEQIAPIFRSSLIESPYRALIGPLMSYLDEVERQRPGDTITVLPEFVAHHLWEHILDNQTALRLKAALLFRPGTVVTSVPYHLDSDVAVVE
ncbi:MAG: hypothetical protein R2855_09775 [Thermomicrobiales bacterium]